MSEAENSGLGAQWAGGVVDVVCATDTIEEGLVRQDIRFVLHLEVSSRVSVGDFLR